jgi:hypothetical protein
MAVTVMVALPAAGLGVCANSVAEQVSASSEPSSIAVRVLAFMILSLPFVASLWLDAARISGVMLGIV